MGDSNVPLRESGVDPLTSEQKEAFEPYWKEQIMQFYQMTDQERHGRLVWAQRMKNDDEFARVWLLGQKELFEIEDADDDGVLQEGEFYRFIQSVRASMQDES